MRYIIAALLLTILITASGCTRADHATEVLRSSGYTDIHITGYRPFAGGDNDTFKTGFEAKSPGGKRVTGTVTEGFLKGATIRLD